jgi:hypothetical protein
MPNIPSMTFLGPIAGAINNTVEHRGNILVPSFAVERALDLLNDGDSPFRLSGRTFTKSVDTSKAINNIKDPNRTGLFIGYQTQGNRTSHHAAHRS